MERSDSGAGPQPRYDVFLSYSHAADGRLAPALQHGLHQLARRWNQVRALRVFRDQESLSANPDLWTTIGEALRASRYFILRASPEAARSSWVAREVGYWRAERERDTFLIVLTGGEIAWDEEAGDFDWDRTSRVTEQEGSICHPRHGTVTASLLTRHRLPRGVVKGDVGCAKGRRQPVRQDG